MIDRFDEFLSQANSARERAAAADGDFKRQWLKVAEMWELLAKEYRRFHDETYAENCSTPRSRQIRSPDR